MQDLLFNVPWWLPTGIIVVGICLFVAGNMRLRTGARNAGAIVVLLGIALALVSYFVETPKEKCSRQTREMISAVVARKWPTFTGLLDPKASLGTVLGTIYSNRTQLVAGAKSSAERWKLDNVIVTSLTARQEQGDITIDTDVLSTQDATMGRPIPSSWQFDWQQTGTGWQMDRITCLKIGDQKISQIAGLIGR